MLMWPVQGRLGSRWRASRCQLEGRGAGVDQSVVRLLEAVLCLVIGASYQETHEASRQKLTKQLRSQW